MEAIERSSPFAYSRTERSIKENGWQQVVVKARKMDEEFRYGLMALGTMAFGAMEWPMAMDDSCTQKAMSTKESGLRIKLMAMGFTPISTEAGTRVNGSQTSSMASELNNGPMAPSTMDSMSRE